MNKFNKQLGFLVLFVTVLTGQAFGAAGDFAIYREVTAGDTIGTTATNLDWDTTVTDTSSTFTQQANGIDIDVAETGHYLIMYSASTQTASGANRSEMQSWIRNQTAGVDYQYGRGQGYIRRAGGTDEGYNQGAAILQLSAGDDVRIQMQRTDSNTATISRRADLSGISLLKLADTWDYIRVRPSSDQAFSSTTFIDLTLGTDDEIDAGTFSRSGSTVTLATVGHYLVTYNVSFSQNDTVVRGNLESRLILDGTEIDGTRVTGFQRGADGTEDSVAAYAGIIETTQTDQELVIQIRRESALSITGLTTTAAETGLAIAKLDDAADYIQLLETTGGQDLSTSRTNITWDTVIEEDVTSFDHATTTERINIEEDGDYLFFSTIYSDRNGGGGTTRETQLLEWQNSSSSASGTDGTGKYLYNNHGQYNRGTQASGGNAFTAGSSTGILMEGLLDTQYVQLTQINEAANNDSVYLGTRMALQGVNLNNLFVPPGNPNTRQLHYRWRDDTTALNTSGGFLAAEDTNFAVAQTSTTYRLRIEVANIGDVAEAASRQYELQWAEKITSCAAISTTTFVGVANGADEFAMQLSNNMTEGQSVTPGLLANTESYTFISGDARETADTTSSLGPLSSLNYTELEYSISPTATAADGTTYCFRVRDANGGGSDLDAYVNYPEMTMAQEDTTQLHYIWRDDSADINTNSGTLALEDTNIAGIDKQTTLRLRMLVANAGTKTEDAARAYELQWGEKGNNSSCSAVATWNGVVSSGTFAMVDSTNISPDGEATTIAMLTAPGGSTRINGEGRDVADTTGSIGPLTSTQHTELEWSFQPTIKAIPGETYCFRVYDTTAAAPIDTYTRYPEMTITSVDRPFAEVGTFTSSIDGGWSTITFNNTYTAPVVVGRTNTQVGQPALNFESRNITSTTAQVRLCESEGSTTSGCDTHAAETIGYIVIDADLTDDVDFIESGTFNIAGEFDTTTQVTNYVESFSSTPYVFTSIQSVNGTAPVVTRVTASSATSFTAGICEQNSIDACNAAHGTETVGWFAVDPNNLPFNMQSEAGTENIGNSDITAITFSPTFSAAPVVLVSTVTNTGGQDVQIDEAFNVTTSGADIRNCEIDTLDVCDTHNPDDVRWLALDSGSSSAFAFDQVIYRFYENNDLLQPTTALAAENTSITDVSSFEELRIRMNVQVGLNDLPATTQAFKLQYGAGAVCSAIGTWTDVDTIGGSGIWRGVDNTGVADGATVTGTLLSESQVFASYEEQNNSVDNPNAINKGQFGEWDWVIEANGPAELTNYCFRMASADGDPLNYINYPQLRTGPQIDVSGTLYIDQGVTEMVTQPTVTAQLNGTGTFSTTAAATGAYAITNISVGGSGDVLSVYIDNAAENGNLVMTISGTIADITDADIYQDRILLRHDDAGPMTNAVLDTYDNFGDTDMLFIVTAGNTFQAEASTEVIVVSTGTFNPGGQFEAVDLEIDGTFITDGYEIDLSGTMDIHGTLDATMGVDGNTTISVEGNWDMTGGEFTNTNSTVLFDGTSGTSSIMPALGGFYNLIVDDSNGGGELNVIMAGTLDVDQDLTITEGAINLDGYEGFIGGNVSLSDTLDASTGTGNNSSLYVQGNWDMTGGTFTNTDSTVIFNGTAAGMITSGGLSFNNLTINDGLVAYWPLDEIASPAIDVSGNEHDGIWFNNSTLNASVSGTIDFADRGSIEFDGVDDYIEVSDSNDLDLTGGEFTLAAWISPDTYGQNLQGRIIDKNGDTGGVDGWSFLIDDNLVADGLTVYTNNTAYSSNAGIIITSQWQHVVVTLSGGTLTYYVNGVAEGTDGGVATPTANTNDVRIGIRSSDLNRDFDGLIDDVRVYSRALTQIEVRNLANGNMPGINRAAYTLQDNLDVNGTLTLNAGELNTGSNRDINIFGSWINYGGIFTANSSSVFFDGTTTGHRILSGAQTYYGVDISGTGGSWRLDDDITLLNGIRLSDGTVVYSVESNIEPLTVMGTMTVAGGTFTGNGQRFRHHGSLIISSGTYTAPSTLLEINESFTHSSGTFTNSGETVMFTGTANEIINSSGSTVFNNVTINSGLVAYWRLDEAASPAFDSSGYEQSGVWTGATTSASVSGSFNFENAASVDFDGTNDYIEFADTDHLDLNTGKFTLSAWIFPDNFGQNLEGRILDKDGETSDQDGWAWLIDDNGINNAMTMYINNNAVSSNATVINTGQWQHVAVTLDNGQLDYYVDGSNVGTSLGVATPGANDSVLRMGIRARDTNRDFNGQIDDVRIYNRVLTSEELELLRTGYQPAISLGEYTLETNLDVNGTLALNAGSLNVSTNNYITNVGAGWSNQGGVFNAQGGTVIFDGTSTDYQIISAEQTFYNVVLDDGDGGGDVGWVIRDSLDVDGTLQITEGTLDASTANYDIFTAGDWHNSGAFTPRTATVYFDGTVAQTVETCNGCVAGNFNNIVIQNNTGSVNFLDSFSVVDFTGTFGGSTLTFESSTTVTISGVLNLNGQSSGNRIILNSSDGVSRFEFDVATEQSVSFVNVSNSEASTSDIVATGSSRGKNTDAPESSPHWVLGPLKGAVILVD